MPDATPESGPGPDGCRCGLAACRSGWPGTGPAAAPGEAAGDDGPDAG